MEKWWLQVWAGKMEGGSAASLTTRELLKVSLEHSGIDSHVRDLET